MVRNDRVIVVTGATGRQGGAVARHLLTDGWRVRALTRKPEDKPARRLADLGAEIVGADMARPETLARALRDAYGVFNVQNPITAGLEVRSSRASTSRRRRSKPASSMSSTAHPASEHRPASAPGIRSWSCKPRCRRSDCRSPSCARWHSWNS